MYISVHAKSTHAASLHNVNEFQTHKINRYNRSLGNVQLNAEMLGLVLVRLGIITSAFDVDAEKKWYGKPYHANKEEEGVADIARRIGDQSDDKGADEGA